jgi:hypothetical protein
MWSGAVTSSCSTIPFRLVSLLSHAYALRGRGEDVRLVAACGMVPSVMVGTGPCPHGPSPLVPHSNLGKGLGCCGAHPWGACSSQLAPGGHVCETSGCSLKTEP